MTPYRLDHHRFSDPIARAARLDVITVDPGSCFSGGGLSALQVGSQIELTSAAVLSTGIEDKHSAMP